MIPLLFLAVLFFAVIVVEVVAATRVYNAVKRVESELRLAEARVVDFEFTQALQHVDVAQVQISKARGGLVFFAWAKPLPWAGDQVKAATAVLNAGEESLLALESAVLIAEDVYGALAEAEELLDAHQVPEEARNFRDLPDDVRVSLLRSLHRSGARMESAKVNLELAQDDLEALDQLAVLPAVTDAIAPFRETIPQLISGLEVLIPVAASIEEIAGVGVDKQWLLLFMNDMEMRPAGGFLGVYGLAVVRDGELVNVEIADTYSVDVKVQGDDSYQIPPPAALQEFVGVTKWYFRDANWSPDFPTAARDATQLLRQEIGHVGEPVPEIHGVFGFTPTFGSRLLEITGPITVQGETFTAENLAMKLEFEVEYGYVEEGIDFTERKAIVGELVDALVDRLMHLPLSEYAVLFSAFEEGFEQKELALYSMDVQTQAVFADAGWAASVANPPKEDVLLVVDANMAALKSDPAVDRSIAYSVEKINGEYIATTAITYTHNGVFDQFTTRYRTYTRVYAPLGSRFISLDGSMQNDRLSNPSLLPDEVTIADDLGMTSFGAFISIEPGAQGTLTFSYALPDSVVELIESRAYVLRVFKQLGAKNHTLTLDLNFDKNIRTATPPEDRSQFGDDRYVKTIELDSDERVIVSF